MSGKDDNRVYFPGLNGLRFFAAFAVIITHIELTKSFFKVNKNLWQEPLFYYLGSLGVFFFFVLSGFLITYLLLKEKEVSGNIAVGKFYLRRIFRIWPLYYLMVIIGFFIMPHFNQFHVAFQQHQFQAHFYDNLILYLIILPNLAFSFFQAVPHVGQLWSIGVEEQFYIFWPWIIRYSNKILKTLTILTIALVLFKASFLFMPDSVKSAWWYYGIKRFIAMSKIESMAIGGIGACLMYYRRNSILKILLNKWLMLTGIVMIPVLIYKTPGQLQDGVHLIYSIIFLTIIMYVASGSKTWIKLEGKLLYELGNISYGIYMYHMLVCGLVIGGLKGTALIQDPLWGNLLIYSLVTFFSILISWLSYKYFEKPFIILKERFARVKSGRAIE